MKLNSKKINLINNNNITLKYLRIDELAVIQSKKDSKNRSIKKNKLSITIFDVCCRNSN